VRASEGQGQRGLDAAQPINPPDGKVIMVEVTEGRASGGAFELTAEAWKRVRCCFTPQPGIRIKDYPP